MEPYDGSDFLDEYFKLCRKHKVYIDACRSPKDLRVFAMLDKEAKKCFKATETALIEDL